MSRELPSAMHDIEPIAAAKHFASLVSLYRESGHEEHARRYVHSWADSRGFAVREDKVGNIAVDVPASPGCNEKQRVIAQGHLDMVCTSADGQYDFKNQPITLARTGDTVHSLENKTTIGADNGMGVAMAMAVAEDPNIKRPPMTLLFTVQEETGCDGAAGIGEDMIPSGAVGIVNLDSEEGPGMICNGSAGGSIIEGRLNFYSGAKIEAKKLPEWQSGISAFKITLKGLKGGHSGVNINEYAGRGSAIDLLAEMLNVLKDETTYYLRSFNGGERHNALAESASAEVFVPHEKGAGFRDLLVQAESELKEQYGDDASLSLEPIDITDDSLCLTESARNETLKTICSLPHGPIESAGRKVSVSSNTGIVRTTDAGVEITCHMRAALDKVEAAARVREAITKLLAQSTGSIYATVPRVMNYDGWQEPPGSRLVSVAEEVTHAQSLEPMVFAYHAGLELQAIRGRLAELGLAGEGFSCVSIGPKITNVHSSREAVHVSTIKPTYDLLVGMLERLAA
ncbi:MAG: peptidase dimerization domain-containing protein [Candidatus Peregrinibacteria bacterium]